MDKILSKIISYPAKSGENPPKTTYLRLRIQKNEILTKTHVNFVKLYLKCETSSQDIRPRGGFPRITTFRAWNRKLQVFSTKIRQKLQIEIFDPNFNFGVFLKNFSIDEVDPFPRKSHLTYIMNSLQNYFI